MVQSSRLWTNNYCSVGLPQTLPSASTHNGMKYQNVWLIIIPDWSALPWERLPLSLSLQWFLSPSVSSSLLKLLCVPPPLCLRPGTAIHHMPAPTFSILAFCFHKMMKGLQIEQLLYFSCCQDTMVHFWPTLLRYRWETMAFIRENVPKQINIKWFRKQSEDIKQHKICKYINLTIQLTIYIHSITI